MTDPFAHGMPAGDHHIWVRPSNPPCPHCECCTEVLCRRAVERDSACHFEGTGPDLANCPCYQEGTPGFTAFGGVPLLDADGYLACGCHSSQREHTCGPLD